MSTLGPRSNTALVALAGALSIPLLAPTAQAQKLLDPRAAPAPEAAAGALIGYGKGRLTLPMICQDGRLFGVLADPDGIELFHLEALLTGCMPGIQLGGVQDYTFGGLYGRVRKLVEADPEYQPQGALFTVEGTWMLDDPTHGGFSATVYKEIESGRRFVSGKIYGEFAVAPAPALAATTNPFHGSALPGKAVKSPFGDVWVPAGPDALGDARAAHKGDVKSPYGDARDKPAVDPFGDARSAHKGGDVKTPYGDVKSKPAVDPFGDARSAHKGDVKTPYGDARDKPLRDPFGDARSAYKGGDVKTPYGDVRSKPAVDPFGDARSAYKGDVKTPYGDARDKPLRDPFGDARSAHKGDVKTPFGDSVSQPERQLTGTFVMRYLFLR